MVSARSASRSDPRAGYALLATLWICAGLGALTWLISVSAREAMATSRNRMAVARATWLARGCLAGARETIRAARALDRGSWNRIDQLLRDRLPGRESCALEARAVGSRLDVNSSDHATLARILPDSAAAAVVARVAQEPFVDRGELRRVRGLETFERLEEVLDVESGPLALNHAPPEVLSLLPGFTDRTVRLVMDARSRGDLVMTFHRLTGWLSDDEPEAAAKLPGLIVLTPVAWIVTARSASGNPRIAVAVDQRMTRDAGVPASSTRYRPWVD
jgi:type II secretory pathway component PulK